MQRSTASTSYISPLDNVTLDANGNLTGDAFTLAQEDYIT